MKRWLFALLFLAGLITSNSSPGAGFIIVEDSRWWPGPNPPQPIPPRPPSWPPPHPIPPYRQYAFAPLEVSSVKVNTRINDQVAVTAIDEEFYNPNSARLEGTFVFPVPKGAHIDKFSMEIDGRQVEAELLGADKARHIYEDIVRKLKDPALLEYAGRDIFKVRIFPIEPNSKKRIKLSYTQLLKQDFGLVNYELPLNTEKFSAKPIKNLSLDIELESKRPLKSIYSPSHPIEVKRHGSNRARIVYESSDLHLNDDFALYFAPEKDEIGVNLLTFKNRGEDGYFLLLASPGMDSKEKHVVLKDVAFVLDTSGSMAGKKLEQAKKALQFCVENLNDGDRFEIIRFSTEVEPLFEKLVEANSSNRSKAGEFIRDLRPIGGTAIDDALKRALELRHGHNRSQDGSERPFVVIFLTDGRPTIGTTDENEIVNGVKHRDEKLTRIFCFGIGNDVNTHLLDRISEETRAFTQYVLPEEDLEVKVSNFFAKIKEPVLANPALKFTGDIRVSKLYPSPLPDLFKGEQLVLVGRYSGSGDSAVIVDGTLNGDHKKSTYEVRFPEDNSDNEFIPRLWATRRVGYLLDEIRLHGENSELRDEVTELARKYGIVTPYTAYLIMEDETRRDVPTPMRSLQSFDRDSAARKQAAQSWHEFKEERVGESAAFMSRYGLGLKNAEAPASASAKALADNTRSLGIVGGRDESHAINSTEAGKLRITQYSQQTTFVAGKNFFQNEKQWTDSALQNNAKSKRTRIQFGSREYFELAEKNPKALPWLALGQNVQFVLSDTIYEIYE